MSVSGNANIGLNQGALILDPSGQHSIPLNPPGHAKSPTGSKTIPAGILIVGVGAVLALADTQFAKPVVWLLAAACVYQAIKPNSGVVSKITTSKPIATSKGS